MRGWRQPEEREHDPALLTRNILGLKYVVCGWYLFDHIDTQTERCCVCGREVHVPLGFGVAKNKLCILCDPQLPELLREENDGEVGKDTETACL